MILEKLHIIITLFAAIVMTVVCILQKTELYDFALRMIAVIIVFYIIGRFVRRYFMKLDAMLKDTEEEGKEEENEEE